MNNYEIMHITNRTEIIDCGVAENAFYRTSILYLAEVRRQIEHQVLLGKEQRIKKNPSLGY